MIKKILPLITVSLFFHTVSAQYCGNSGTFQCTASNLSLPWLTPPPDSLAPFVNGQPSTTVIQFKNFNQVYFSGSYYTVTSLRIDTVDNLPSGLCWASNKADNTYANQESGCLKVNGTPCGPTGQYKMRIIVSVDLGFGVVQVDADQAGLKYYIRLKNSGDADTPIDTFQTAANPIIPYGGSCGVLPLTAYLGTDPTVCSGSIATLNPSISGGQGPFTYQWSATGNSLSCQNCANPTVTLTQNSTFIVTVTDANNATAKDTIVYTVTGSGNNFHISASGATSFCQGGSVTLSGTSSSGFTYQWLSNNINVASANTTSLAVGSSGNYMLIFSGSGGCFATSNVITVNVSVKPNASITTQPASACAGDTLHLIAQVDTSVHSFHWLQNGTLTGDSVATYGAVTAGTYKLVVKNSIGCPDTVSLNVSFKPLPQVNLNGNQDTVCSTTGAIALIGGSPSGGVYSGAGVTGNNFTPSSAGVGTHVIHYTYTDTASCSSRADEVIWVVLCTGINDLTAENSMALYPNPVRDLLTIESDYFDYNNLHLSVYDITGKQQVINYKLQAGKIVVHTNTLSPGIYVIKLNMGDKEVSQKFIKAE